MLDNTSGTITGTNNSSDAQGKNTNPFSVSAPATLAEFNVSAAGYAYQSGTSTKRYKDFDGKTVSKLKTQNMGAI